MSCSINTIGDTYIPSAQVKLELIPQNILLFKNDSIISSNVKYLIGVIK